MLYAIAAVLIVIADQWLKYYVTANIVLNTGAVELIPGVLNLVNIHNEGAAFSLFQGARWVFVVIGVLFTALVVFALVKKLIRGPFGRWTAALTMAGAVGNLIDRVLLGYVVDMFEVPPIGILQIFNIADIFITVGGILFCFYIIFGGREKKEEKEQIPDSAETAEKVEADDCKPEEKPAPKKAEKPAPRHEAAPKHRAQKTAAAPERAPAPKAEAVSESFSLDDILDEFK